MADMMAAAETFGRELLEEMGDRVRSIVVYGSVARGDAVEGVSDINLLVLLDRLDVETLQRLSRRVRKWTRDGSTAPLVMAADEWRRAADVFAIEVAEMTDWHRRLHGDDPVAGAAVERGALRLQAERELRAKQIQLREALLVTAERATDVGRLLMGALPSFATYLRAALRLVNGSAPADSAESIREGCALVGADPSGMLRVLEARRARRALSLDITHADVGSYYDAVARTASFVDTL